MTRQSPAKIATSLCLATLAASAIVLTSAAQTLNTPNTVNLEPGGRSPTASIADFAWLKGHWRADALGGTAEEWWADAAGGAMVGMFRAVADGKVMFYELFILAPVGESVELRLKHFNSDLTGWEEKDDMEVFPLVTLEAKSAHFAGLTYELAGPDTLKSYVAVRQKDGSSEELEFRFSRVPVNESRDSQRSTQAGDRATDVLGRNGINSMESGVGDQRTTEQ